MEEVHTRLPELFEEINEDIRDKDPIEIKSDLEKLHWLSVINPLEVFKNFIEMTDNFGVSLLEYNDKFSILELPQVQYFINTMVFQLTSKRDIKDICAAGTEYIQKTRFFKASREKITAKHDDIESVVEEINTIYNRFLNILTIGFMHISKKFDSKNKKDFTTFINDLFYNDVLLNAQFAYKNSVIIQNIIALYKKKQQYPYNSYNKLLTNLYFGEVGENERRCGFGRISFENGDKYEGTWENDAMHGQGLYIWRKNGWYKGEFTHGEQTGRGIRRFPNGGNYEGDFVKGKRHGAGRMEFKNGDLYVGNWYNDAMSGEGEYLWAKTKDIYKGKFRYDVRSSGVLTLSTGETFKISN